jgi:hypothetical protein
MNATVVVNRQALLDLVRVKEEFDTIVESLELMADDSFMESYKEAKKQIKEREFDDWNAL